eukprot:5968789-Prymnesium_polylepis.3
MAHRSQGAATRPSAIRAPEPLPSRTLRRRRSISSIPSLASAQLAARPPAAAARLAAIAARDAPRHEPRVEDHAELEQLRVGRRRLLRLVLRLPRARRETHARAGT